MEKLCRFDVTEPSSRDHDIRGLDLVTREVRGLAKLGVFITPEMKADYDSALQEKSKIVTEMVQ